MEKLENVLATILEKTLEVAEKTGEFVLDVAPEVLQEFYRWHLWSNVVVCVICIVVPVVSIWLGKFTVDEDGIEYETIRLRGKRYNAALFLVWAALSAVSVVICFINFVISAAIVLKISVAPKLFLIEYFLK